MSCPYAGHFNKTLTFKVCGLEISCFNSLHLPVRASKSGEERERRLQTYATQASRRRDFFRDEFEFGSGMCRLTSASGDCAE